MLFQVFSAETFRKPIYSNTLTIFEFYLNNEMIDNGFAFNLKVLGV